MSNYPPGVHGLPDDEMFTCDNCGVKNNFEGYDDCPECGDHNVCNSCLFCHSCSSQYKECDCGSGNLVDHLADSCSECTEEVECSNCHNLIPPTEDLCEQCLADQEEEPTMLCAWCEEVEVPVSDGYCSKRCHDNDKIANGERE